MIVDTISTLSKSFDFVFTSGGIGPTHDDITYQAIAQAFHRPIVPDVETINRMHEHLKISSLNAGQLRMASLPSPDELIFSPDLWVPLVRVKNVLLLPGVPRLFHTLLDHWFTHHLQGSGLKLVPKVRRLIRTELRESVLAHTLTELQSEVASYGIELGSYPKLLEDSTSFVVISVIGPSETEEKVEEAVQKILCKFNGRLVDTD